MAEQSYGAAVDQAVPQYHVRQVEFHERPIQYEIVILPLSKTGERVDMLMTVVTREGRAEPEAGFPVAGCALRHWFWPLASLCS